MLTAVVNLGSQTTVTFVRAGDEHAVDCEFELEPGETNGEYTCAPGPGPIVPEVKELAWGAGAFIVLALLLRFWLVPAVKKGMDARYAHIRGGREAADAARAAAQAEVADYEAALATVKAEAATRVDAARQTLETERAARLAEVNAEIAARREAATAEVAASRAAAAGDVAGAVRDLAGRTLELALGRPADSAAVSAAVDSVTSAGVGS